MLRILKPCIYFNINITIWLRNILYDTIMDCTCGECLNSSPRFISPMALVWRKTTYFWGLINWFTPHTMIITVLLYQQIHWERLLILKREMKIVSNLLLCQNNIFFMLRILEPGIYFTINWFLTHTMAITVLLYRKIYWERLLNTIYSRW